MEDINISEKVYKFETFVNDVLKEDLKKFEGQLHRVNSEIAEYLELKNMIQCIDDANLGPDGFKTKVDVGCNFYMQANVGSCSQIFVDIGLNHYVELTHREALKFVEMRVDLLTRKANVILKNSAKTKGHIKLVLHGIAELQNLPLSLEKPKPPE